MSTERQERIISGIKSGIKPEVQLTREHKVVIGVIYELWQKDSSLARKLERNFIAICNNETHD